MRFRSATYIPSFSVNKSKIVLVFGKKKKHLFFSFRFWNGVKKKKKKEEKRVNFMHEKTAANLMTRDFFSSSAAIINMW